MTKELPTTEQIKEAARKGFVAPLGYNTISPADFDRWLSQVKIEAKREGRRVERERTLPLLEQLDARTLKLLKYQIEFEDIEKTE